MIIRSEVLQEVFINHVHNIVEIFNSVIDGCEFVNSMKAKYIFNDCVFVGHSGIKSSVDCGLILNNCIIEKESNVVFIRKHDNNLTTTYKIEKILQEGSSYERY